MAISPSQIPLAHLHNGIVSLIEKEIDSKLKEAKRYSMTFSVPGIVGPVPGHWIIVQVDEYISDASLECIKNLYENVGWTVVSCTTSERNGERPGLFSIKLFAAPKEPPRSPSFGEQDGDSF